MMPKISDEEPLFKVALDLYLSITGLGKWKDKEAEKSSECILTLGCDKILLLKHCGREVTYKLTSNI